MPAVNSTNTTALRKSLSVSMVQLFWMMPTGEFYPEMEQAVRNLSRRLYQIALGEGNP